MTAIVTTLAIAPIGDADIADVVALWQTCGLTRPWNDPAADIALARKGSNAAILIGRDNAAIIATVLVGHDGHRGWVYYLAVDPGHRNHGYGRIMMIAAEKWLRDHGIEKLQLLVRAGNSQVKDFYQSLGYAMQDRIIYAKWLDAASPRRNRSNEVTVSDRIRIKDERVLSDHYGTLKSTVFEWRRNDGTWQTLTRNVFDRGNAAAILPYNRAQRTVVLVRQFRLPTYFNGYDDLLIEAAAGLLDNAAPEDRIRAEAEEEIGFRLHDVHKVFEAFMSPGAVTEKIHFFVAEYEPEMRISSGGGLADEGEDIEVLELPFDEALTMIEDGRIADAKTIMLLQHAALNIFK